MTTSKADDNDAVADDSGSLVRDRIDDAVDNHSAGPSDIEALLPVPTNAVKVLSASSHSSEASVRVQLFALLIWMINNVLVTMLNKASFATVEFKHPYALSAVHMVCNIIGAESYLLLNTAVKPKVIEPSQRVNLWLFSVIFSLNIAIGNTSLRWVSVNFNQVCRSLVPVIVLLISILYYKKTISYERKVAVLPIVVGVAMASYGEMTATAVGSAYTLLCILLAALKGVLGGELLSGDLKLHEMDLLSKMCPLALLQIGLASILTGEVSAIIGRWDEIVSSSAPQVVMLSGVLSFTLNVSSLIANKVTSPLTLAIAANIKQVLTIAFGTLYFGDSVSALNGTGIMLVLIGSYSYAVACANH